MKDKGKRSTDAVVISKCRQLPLSDLFSICHLEYVHQLLLP